MTKLYTFPLCIFLLCIALPILVCAEDGTLSNVKKIEPYVNDFVGVLTKDQIMQLNLLADSIEQNTTWEIAMVTIKNTNGWDRLDLANRIGDENGVGKKDKDNGIVVLWSEDGDRGLAIATGRYSDSIFNDAKVGRIARAARPYFDNKSYYEGFLNITQELKTEIDGIILWENRDIVNPTPDTNWILWVVFGVIVVILVVRAFADSDIGDGVGFNATSLGSLGRIGGGRSFGSFGGGSFSGGGAKG